MSRSVNKVILLGNVGKDPEVVHTTSGKAVAKFSLATNERFKSTDGEWQDRTEWHNIVAWEKLATVVDDYVKKGSKLYIEGRIQTRSWDDKETGAKRYMTEITAHELVMLDKKEDNKEEANGNQAEPQAVTVPDDDIPF